MYCKTLVENHEVEVRTCGVAYVIPRNCLSGPLLRLSAGAIANFGPFDRVFLTLFVASLHDTSKTCYPKPPIDLDNARL